MLTSILRTQIAAHPYGHILLSFPFLGPIAAATIIGIIKDIDRWPDKKKFKKALGAPSVAFGFRETFIGILMSLFVEGVVP